MVLVLIIVQEISWRVAVSRGTVRNLLADAQAYGWFVELARPEPDALAAGQLQRFVSLARQFDLDDFAAMQQLDA